jgi:hypothetical protein
MHLNHLHIIARSIDRSYAHPHSYVQMNKLTRLLVPGGQVELSPVRHKRHDQSHPGYSSIHYLEVIPRYARSILYLHPLSSMHKLRPREEKKFRRNGGQSTRTGNHETSLRHRRKRNLKTMQSYIMYSPFQGGKKQRPPNAISPHQACLYEKEEKLCAGICCRRR